MTYRSDVAPLYKEDLNSAVRRHIKRLYRVAWRLTGNPQLAEDVVGQTLYQVARAWDKFDGRHAEAWMLKILTNVVRESGRKWGNICQSEQNLPDGFPSSDDLHAQVMSKMNSESVRSAMARLSVDHQIVLTLCDLEDMKYDEVAIALKIAKGTVASRLFRARNALHLQLVKESLCD